jgi:integrase
MACIKKRRGKWVVDYRDTQGQRKWETKPNKKAAQERLAEILQSQGLTPLIADDRTVKAYGDWWLENIAKGSIKESTYQEYDAVLKNHVYPTLGAHQFSKVSRAMIRELIAAKKGRGLCDPGGRQRSQRKRASYSGGAGGKTQTPGVLDL